MVASCYIVGGVLADGEAWIGLNTSTLGSDAALVTFKSGFADGDDPAGSGSGGVQNWDQYMDLVLIGYARSAVSSASGGCYVVLNNDTGANYTVQWFYGNGSSLYVNSGTTYTYVPLGNIPANTAGANEFNGSIVHLFDINSGKYKSCLTTNAQDSNGDGQVALDASVWRNQAPISEIDISASADLKSGSMFSLFGILPRMVA